MQTFLGAIINGLALGMAYALIAVGYSMVFGVLRLINFSHGSVYAFGAYMIYFFVSMKVGLFPAILIAIVLSGLLALTVDKVALEPLRRKKSIPIATLITTIGMSFIIQNVLSIDYIFGSEKHGFPSLNLFAPITVGNQRELFSVQRNHDEILAFIASCLRPDDPARLDLPFPLHSGNLRIVAPGKLRISGSPVVTTRVCS